MSKVTVKFTVCFTILSPPPCVLRKCIRKSTGIKSVPATAIVVIVVAFRILFYSPSFSVIVLPCCSFPAQFGPKHFIATLHARVVQSFHFHAICLRLRGQEMDGGKECTGPKAQWWRQWDDNDNNNVTARRGRQGEIIALIWSQQY